MNGVSGRKPMASFAKAVNRTVSFRSAQSFSNPYDFIVKLYEAQLIIPSPISYIHHPWDHAVSLEDTVGGQGRVRMRR